MKTPKDVDLLPPTMTLTALANILYLRQLQVFCIYVISLASILYLRHLQVFCIYVISLASILYLRHFSGKYFVFTSFTSILYLRHFSCKYFVFTSLIQVFCIYVIAACCVSESNPLGPTPPNSICHSLVHKSVLFWTMQNKPFWID